MQKIKEGEPFSGRQKAEDEFDAVDDAEWDDDSGDAGDADFL